MMPMPRRDPDPDSLLIEWQRLRQHHEHLHQPQAAAMLAVPEAQLVAAQVGHGATQLHGDPADILSAVAGLGKLLIAAPHHAGVLMGIARPVCYSQQAGNIILFDAHSRLEVAIGSIASLYVLLEEHGPHGRQRHLQVFNAQGHALFKLLILYKRHSADLHALATRFRAPQQTRNPQFLPTASGMPPINTADASVVDKLVAHLQCWVTDKRALQIRCHTPDTELCVKACQPRIYGMADGFVHFRHPNMKLHARLAQMGHLQNQTDQWHCHRGTSTLSFTRLST